MTVSRQPDSPATPELIVRDYAEGDYGACRSLWTELTEYHRSIYGDPAIGGDDPGAGLDGYLAELQRMGSWVAESHGRVVGLTGLLDRGTSGEVEPVVVAQAARDQGIGRMLISRVVEEARARGYEYLAIRPVARNVAAVRRFPHESTDRQVIACLTVLSSSGSGRRAPMWRSSSPLTPFSNSPPSGHLRDCHRSGGGDSSRVLVASRVPTGLRCLPGARPRRRAAGPPAARAGGRTRPWRRGLVAVGRHPATTTPSARTAP